MQTKFICAASSSTGQFNGRFAVGIGHDLNLLPTDSVAVLDTDPQDLAGCLLGGESRR
jgi:hypothetical protein